MKKVLIIYSLLIFSCFLCGCQTVTVTGSGTQLENNSKFIHGSMYGYTWNEVNLKLGKKDRLYTVEFADNYLFDFVGVITLGIYKPVEVYYTYYVPEDESQKEEGTFKEK